MEEIYETNTCIFVSPKSNLSVCLSSLNELSFFSVGNALVNYNTDPLLTCHLDFQCPGKDSSSFGQSEVRTLQIGHPPVKKKTHTALIRKFGDIRKVTTLPRFFSFPMGWVGVGLLLTSI
jgi:hypothetical protein